MKYKLYTTSVKAWDAMIKNIDQAKKSIYIEMYIFLDDTAKSHDFIGKLKEKAASGVHVVIVADAYGSKDLKKIIESSIEKSQIEFLFFSNWLRHIHRKILIIDERIAFIGGVNIGKRFRNWNDLQLKVKGHITKTILRSFAYTYEMAGGKDQKIIKYRKRKLTLKLKYWILEHLPHKNIHTLKNHYIEKITGAKKTIQISTPYFTPPRWFVSLIDNAVRRGVQVEILIPKEVDWQIMNTINHHYMQKLAPLGIKFYLGRKMNHAKMLLIDNQEGLIGSSNIDLLSFKFNSEIGLFFQDKKLIDELATVIKKWKQNSIIYKSEKYKMRPVDYLILLLVKILHPIL